MEVNPVSTSTPANETDGLPTLVVADENNNSTKSLRPVKYFLWTLLALVLLGAIAFIANKFFLKSFTNSTVDESAVDYSGPIEKVRIGNVGEYTIFNLIAQDKGYFKEYGLDASIKEYTSGPSSLEGMFKGETDINVAADFVGVRNIFDHPDLRILSQVNYHRVFQIASRKELGVSKPSDLSGKKIGVTKNSAGEYFLGVFLSENNIKLEEVTMIDLTPAEMITKLESGDIDAVALFEPHIFKIKSKLGDDVVTWDVQGNHNISALIYSTSAFIDKNPGVVERYIKALVKAEDYYKSNPEEVKEIVERVLKYEKTYIDYSWPKFTHFIGLNQELILNMESEARWVIKNKLTDKTVVPNYLEFMYFDGLSKVKPEAVTIVH